MYSASNLCSRILWIYIRSSHKKKSLSVLSHIISHTSAEPESCLCQLADFLTIQSQKLETPSGCDSCHDQNWKQQTYKTSGPLSPMFQFQEKLPVFGKTSLSSFGKTLLQSLVMGEFCHVLSATESGATLDTLSRQRLVSFCQVRWLPRISTKISMIELYKHIKNSSVKVEICGNDRNIDDKSLLRANVLNPQHGWLGTPMRNTPICGFFSTPNFPATWPLWKQSNWDVDAGVTRRCASKSTTCSAISILHRSQKWQKSDAFLKEVDPTTSQRPNFFARILKDHLKPQRLRMSGVFCAVRQWFSAIVGRLVAWWWWIELWKESTIFAKIPQNAPKIASLLMILHHLGWSFFNTHFPWARNLPTLGLLRVLLEENLEGPLFEGSLREG